jgi:hypothetical protein
MVSSIDLLPLLLCVMLHHPLKMALAIQKYLWCPCLIVGPHFLSVGFSDSGAGCAELNFTSSKWVATTQESATVASMGLQYSIPSASFVGE